MHNVGASKYDQRAGQYIQISLPHVTNNTKPEWHKTKT